MSSDHLDNCIKSLEASGNYRIIKRFAPVDSYCLEQASDEKLFGLYVDVETTGLNAGSDKIIELAMVTFEFLPDGRIFKILEQFDQFQDPGIPIPEGITALTGITNAMVKGQTIDKDLLNHQVKSVSVVIAHNAQFDRQFLESAFPVFEEKAWALSRVNYLVRFDDN